MIRGQIFVCKERHAGQTEQRPIRGQVRHLSVTEAHLKAVFRTSGRLKLDAAAKATWMAA